MAHRRLAQRVTVPAVPRSSRRGALHPKQGAEIPGHHRILAAAGVSVEPRKRRHLEGEHRNARHKAVGKARATGPDRIWDVVEMLSEGFFCHVPARFCLIIVDSGQNPRKKVFCDQINPLWNMNKKISGNYWDANDAIRDGYLPEPKTDNWTPVIPQAERWRGKLARSGKNLWRIVREKAREVCAECGWAFMPDPVLKMDENDTPTL